MANEEDFDILFDGALELQLNNLARQSKFKSIKDISVYRKIVKVKWFFNLLSYRKQTRTIMFVVDEPQFIMESLIDDLNIENFISPYREKDDLLVICNLNYGPMVKMA